MTIAAADSSQHRPRPPRPSRPRRRVQCLPNLTTGSPSTGHVTTTPGPDPRRRTPHRAADQTPQPRACPARANRTPSPQTWRIQPLPTTQGRRTPRPDRELHDRHAPAEANPTAVIT